MSPFHFQRLFRRWAGISPKRFLQLLTIEYAKDLLRESRSVLDATYEAGLSSPGRLHDLFVAIEAVTPGEFKQEGAGLQIDYAVHPSPFGECLLAVTDRGVCGLYFLIRERTERALAQLQAHWPKAELRENASRTADFIPLIFPWQPGTASRRLTLLMRGTNFQIKVWQALLNIPPGHICSYEDLARYLGKPGAARAVGNAVAANPVSFIIPCHRVIRGTGMIGNYAGGPIRKRALLAWEAAQRDQVAVS